MITIQIEIEDEHVNYSIRGGKKMSPDEIMINSVCAMATIVSRIAECIGNEIPNEVTLQ